MSSDRKSNTKSNRKSKLKKIKTKDSVIISRKANKAKKSRKEKLYDKIDISVKNSPASNTAKTIDAKGKHIYIKNKIKNKTKQKQMAAIFKRIVKRNEIHRNCCYSYNKR